MKSIALFIFIATASMASAKGSLTIKIQKQKSNHEVVLETADDETAEYGQK